MRTNKFYWYLLDYWYLLVLIDGYSRPADELVGERSVCSEAYGVNRGGAHRSENVGMSSA